MVNFDGVYELRWFYTSTVGAALLLPHVLTYDVNITTEAPPGFDWTDFEVTNRNLSTNDLGVHTDAMSALLLPCFSADAEFSRVELWKIPEGTLNGTFLSVLELGEPGTNAGANTLSQQTTFTFRSAGGNGGRIQLMESAFSGNARQSPPFGTTAANNLSNYVIGVTSPIFARDNTPFIARVAQCDGQSEVVWRKRNRA